MSYIYLITNIMNGKQYVGYTSQTPQKRFSEHKYESFNRQDYGCYFHNAIRKYGIENFKLETLYEFSEEEECWQDLERYYIQEYNTLRPNGYNELPGGNSPPIFYGNDNIKTKLPDDQIEILYSYLQDLSLSYKEISKKTGLTVDYLYLINQGKYRKREGWSYPIRKHSQREEEAIKIIALLKNDTTLSLQKIANLMKTHWSTKDIASINTGKKYSIFYEGEYPIRKITVPNDYEEKQQLAISTIKLIQEKFNFKVSKATLKNEYHIGRTVLDKILLGVYPYNIKNVEYPIKLKK